MWSENAFEYQVWAQVLPNHIHTVVSALNNGLELNAAYL